MELPSIKNIESIESGIIIPEFLYEFNNTFNESGVCSLKNFVQRINCSKWTIYSDYSFKGKVNDTITFSIIPYIFDFEEFKKRMSALAPSDLKNTRNIEPGFLEFLRSMPIMHISILLNKKRRLNYDDEKNFILQKTNALIKKLKHWCETTPEAKDNYLKQIRNFKSLINKLKRNSPNLSVIRDIEIVATLVSYLITEMSLAKELEIIGWFSDRDTILNYMKSNTANPVVFDLVDLYTFALSENQDKLNRPKLAFGVPEETNAMWYDEFNRIPDYIAGTIADYDILNNAVSNLKFKTIIEEAIASNEKVLCYKLILDKCSIQVSRIKIEKSEHAAPGGSPEPRR